MLQRSEECGFNLLVLTDAGGDQKRLGNGLSPGPEVSGVEWSSGGRCQHADPDPRLVQARSIVLASREPIILGALIFSVNRS